MVPTLNVEDRLYASRVCNPENLRRGDLVGFFYKQYILEQPQDAAIILAKLSATTIFINAVVSLYLMTIIYNLIRPILKKQDYYYQFN